MKSDPVVTHKDYKKDLMLAQNHKTIFGLISLLIALSFILGACTDLQCRWLAFRPGRLQYVARHA